MNFELPDETLRVREELGRWAAKRRAHLGEYGPFDQKGWTELTKFGLMHGTTDHMRDLEVAAGMLATGAGGLPGPVLEADLAVAAGNAEASEMLREGRVVTSVTPYAPTPCVVGWGEVANLVVDQGSGETIVREPLPEARSPLPTAHGWLALPRPGNGHTPDSLLARRSLMASALVVGLGQGALEIASQHVRTREQFGRTLSSFQAVQFRLAEASVLLEAAELAVFDCARRSDAGDPSREVTAALCWLNAWRIGAIVEKHVHQVLGGIGFTAELGVIQLTYQMSWLRMSIGRGEARRLILANRSHSPGAPASNVLGGFSLAAVGAASAG